VAPLASLSGSRSPDGEPRYRYLDVPLEAATGLRTSFARGEFFNVHIRGRFDYEEEPFDPALKD
jgi:hypothetical protein